MSLLELTRYCDSLLRISEIDDWPNALNGLQIENSGRLKKIGAAVDVSTRTLAAATERGINLLVVHHGLFWPGLQSITGGLYRQLKCAFEHDIALYSAHVPLDIHPALGNNAQLAAALDFKATEPFFETKGQKIGLKTSVSMSRAELLRRLESCLGGEVKIIAAGVEEVRQIGIITGGAGSEVYGVTKEGIDTFITGEAPHWAAIAAEELGVNLILGGHYATETFGVKALATHLSERFGLPWEFIDSPTGL